nr:MAG TPA: hypothetical protein [Caudoviricetes sp.]
MKSLYFLVDVNPWNINPKRFDNLSSIIPTGFPVSGSVSYGLIPGAN